MHEPLVGSDPSFKVKAVIAEVQSRFRYTISFWKAWMAKQKTIEKVYGSWEASYEALLQWCAAMCDAIWGSVIQLDAVEAYHGANLVSDARLLRRVFWTFGPCIRAFRHYKLVV